MVIAMAQGTIDRLGWLEVGARGRGLGASVVARARTGMVGVGGVD